MKALLPVSVIPMLLVASLSYGQDIVPAFSGESAFKYLEEQCALGPRTPGSEGNLKLREMIVSLAEEQGLSVGLQCLEIEDPLGSGPLEICNIIVSAGPSGGKRLWVGAHFDTRPVCDRDPDPAKRKLPLVGANDGASGTAILMHLIEILGKYTPQQGVDLIFFDGEDSGTSGDPTSYCKGSQHLANTWKNFGVPLATGEPVGLILLDMVGEKNANIPREGYSNRYAPAFCDRIFSRAESLGLDVFQNYPGASVYDDHVPFLQKGIPAVDLIDFDFPQWHTAADTPAICSAESLEQVGTLVTDLIFRP
jgi:glutaminyl-peptide cyclotransferase